MKRILLCSAALVALAAPALADQTIPINVSLRVGATKRLWVVSAHHGDCSTDDGYAVEVRTAPALGQVSQQGGIPSKVSHSMSGTCLGATVTGTAVDYTATQAGTDHFEFDGVFRNGRARFFVTARNR